MHFKIVDLNRNPLGKAYFEGHKQDDVVLARKKYLDILEEADQKRYGSHNILRENERPVICVYHDESTFYANTQQSSYWNDGTNIVLCQKSMGSAIMVSVVYDWQCSVM